VLAHAQFSASSRQKVPPVEMRPLNWARFALAFCDPREPTQMASSSRYLHSTMASPCKSDNDMVAIPRPHKNLKMAVSIFASPRTETHVTLCTSDTRRQKLQCPAQCSCPSPRDLHFHGISHAEGTSLYGHRAWTSMCAYAAWYGHLKISDSSPRADGYWNLADGDGCRVSKRVAL
jgi:hypothetical protein